MVIIAICGCKSSGKDTVADYISRRNSFEKIAFSELLKRVCRELFHFSDKQLYNQEGKETVGVRWGITPRVAMQFIGKEMFQYNLQGLLPELGHSFWERRLSQSIQKGKNYVIPDLRFMYEYNELLQLGETIIVIRITRPGINIEQHLSETECMTIPVNYTLENTSKIKLMKKVDCIFFTDPYLDYCPKQLKITTFIEIK